MHVSRSTTYSKKEITSILRHSASLIWNAHELQIVGMDSGGENVHAFSLHSVFHNLTVLELESWRSWEFAARATEVIKKLVVEILLDLSCLQNEQLYSANLNDVRNGKPNRRLLDMRPQLGTEPSIAGRLRNRIRPERYRRPRRCNLRGDRYQRWRHEPRVRDAAMGRDSAPASVDNLRKRHDDHAQAGAHYEQLENTGWTRS